MAVRCEGLGINILDAWSLALGVSIYGNDEKLPGFDTTAIVDLVPLARTLRTHDQ